MVEVTNRTFQKRYLLLPTRKLRRIARGVLGRVQRKLSMPIHGLTFASNHFHLLVTPKDADRLAQFMGRVEQKLSVEVRHLYDWEGSLWQDRYHAIPIENDERAQAGRLRHILSHGVKEGLVGQCAQWPGAHCVTALTEGEQLTGTWYDRTAQYRANRWSGETVDEEQFAEDEEIVLTPLPCWAHHTEEERRDFVREMIAEIEAEAAAKHRAQGTRPLGVKKILRHHPWERPKRAKRSPRPWCHAATAEGRELLKRAYQLFAAAFRDAAQLLKDGVPDPPFPEGSFPPGRPFVPHAAPG